MTNERRKSDIELAVLTEKVDALSSHVIKHMDEEEAERKEIWKELRKLDRKLIFLAMPLIAAGGGGVPEILQMFGFM